MAPLFVSARVHLPGTGDHWLKAWEDKALPGDSTLDGRRPLPDPREPNQMQVLGPTSRARDCWLTRT